MYAALINGIAVAVAALCGFLFKNKINEKYTSAILLGLAIVVGIIGASYAIGTEDTLGMILCIVAGILFGEWINIEKHLNHLGDMLKKTNFPPSLGDTVINEMSAIGGVLMIAISLNMLNIKKIRVGNMLPAVFLPILYQPFVRWLTSLF